MPVKNAEKYLIECLDSIINQTYKSWELIAVDDHSDDNSYQVLLEYSFKDSRIIPFKNQGKGIIEALRHALNQSSGNMISRMDADDIMMENKLEYLQHSLSLKGKGFVAVGLVEYFSEQQLGIGYLIYESWLNSLSYHGSNFDEIYKECVIPSPSWLVYREDLVNAGAFDNDLYPEDYDLAFRFYRSGLKVIPAKQILHRWRDYAERTSRNDEKYRDNQFLELKLRYFMELDRDHSRPLVLWGAGKKGKALAKRLVKMEADFFWVSNNPKKKGVNIYGRVVQEVVYIEALEKPQIIINVSSPEDQSAIRAYLEAGLLEPVEDYFFFC